LRARNYTIQLISKTATNSFGLTRQENSSFSLLIQLITINSHLSQQFITNQQATKKMHNSRLKISTTETSNQAPRAQSTENYTNSKQIKLITQKNLKIDQSVDLYFICRIILLTKFASAKRAKRRTRRSKQTCNQARSEGRMASR